MGKLTKAQEVRLFAGRAVYYAMWAPAVVIAVPFVILHWTFESMAETVLPVAGRIIRPLFGWWHSVALSAGNAVFGKAGRAALAPTKET